MSEENKSIFEHTEELLAELYQLVAHVSYLHDTETIDPKHFKHIDFGGLMERFGPYQVAISRREFIDGVCGDRDEKTKF